MVDGGHFNTGGRRSEGVSLVLSSKALISICVFNDIGTSYIKCLMQFIKYLTLLCFIVYWYLPTIHNITIILSSPSKCPICFQKKKNSRILCMYNMIFNTNGNSCSIENTNFFVVGAKKKKTEYLPTLSSHPNHHFLVSPSDQDCTVAGIKGLQDFN